MTREEAIKVLNMVEAYGIADEAKQMAIKALSQEPCTDAVSREAVNKLIDELARAISDERCHIPQRGRDTGHIMHDILDLPSVTPKPTECDDAISRDAVDKYIARLLSGYLYDGERERLEIFSAYLWELPSVTPQKSDNKYRKEAKRWKNKWLKSQKSGKWIETDEGFSPYECSVCGSIEFKGSKYCPNCGAKMESEE